MSNQPYFLKNISQSDQLPLAKAIASIPRITQYSKKATQEYNLKKQAYYKKIANGYFKRYMNSFGQLSKDGANTFTKLAQHKLIGKYTKPAQSYATKVWRAKKYQEMNKFVTNIKQPKFLSKVNINDRYNFATYVSNMGYVNYEKKNKPNHKIQIKRALAKSYQAEDKLSAKGKKQAKTLKPTLINKLHFSASNYLKAYYKFNKQQRNTTKQHSQKAVSHTEQKPVQNKQKVTHKKPIKQPTKKVKPQAKTQPKPQPKAQKSTQPAQHKQSNGYQIGIAINKVVIYGGRAKYYLGKCKNNKNQKLVNKDKLIAYKYNQALKKPWSIIPKNYQNKFTKQMKQAVKAGQLRNVMKNAQGILRKHHVKLYNPYQNQKSYQNHYSHHESYFDKMTNNLQPKDKSEISSIVLKINAGNYYKNNKKNQAKANTRFKQARTDTKYLSNDGQKVYQKISKLSPKQLDKMSFSARKYNHKAYMNKQKKHTSNKPKITSNDVIRSKTFEPRVKNLSYNDKYNLTKSLAYYGKNIYYGLKGTKTNDKNKKAFYSKQEKKNYKLETKASKYLRFDTKKYYKKLHDSLAKDPKKLNQVSLEAQSYLKVHPFNFKKAIAESHQRKQKKVQKKQATQAQQKQNDATLDKAQAELNKQGNLFDINDNQPSHQTNSWSKKIKEQKPDTPKKDVTTPQKDNSEQSKKKILAKKQQQKQSRA